MKKITIGLVVVAILILVGVVLVKRSGGESQAAALAPEDTVFFANIPNVPQTGFRWIGTALAQIAAEPEMRAFLELPLKNLKESPSSGEVGGLASALKPGNIFLAAMPTEDQSVKALLGFQFWGGRKDFDNAIARLRKELPNPDQEAAKEAHKGLEILATSHGDLTLYSAAAGRWGFLSTNLDSIKTALDRAEQHCDDEMMIDEVKKEEVKTALREHGAKHSLFYAAEMGMVELVADLIKEGANVNEKNHVSLKRVLSASA